MGDPAQKSTLYNGHNHIWWLQFFISLGSKENDCHRTIDVRSTAIKTPPKQSGGQ